MATLALHVLSDGRHEMRGCGRPFSGCATWESLAGSYHMLEEPFSLPVCAGERKRGDVVDRARRWWAW